MNDQGRPATTSRMRVNRRTVLAVSCSLAGCAGMQEHTADSATTATHMTTTPLVTGTIAFRPTRPDLTDTTVFVRLKDSSRADAPATVVAETVIRNPADRATADGIPFTLRGDEDDIEPQRRYSVAAHVDTDGDADVSRGDYVSTDTNPVSTRDLPADLTIPVERVE